MNGLFVGQGVGVSAVVVSGSLGLGGGKGESSGVFGWRGGARQVGNGTERDEVTGMRVGHNKVAT